MAARKQMSLKQMEVQAKAACFDWNAKYPDGTLVSYESIVGRGETKRVQTAGEAFVSSCEAVVFVSGISGYVSLDHCTAIQEE